MNRLITHISSLIVITFLSACSGVNEADYQSLTWKDLKPSQETAAAGQLAGSPSMSGLDDDWFQNGDPLGGDLVGMRSGPPSQAFSSGTVSELDGANVRVGGYIVPLEFDGANSVSEFFLVPYFGACFHMPPPPPNQTIYVTSDQAVEYESIYDPVWIMGALEIKQTGNEIATAAYHLKLESIVPYEE